MSDSYYTTSDYRLMLDNTKLAVQTDSCFSGLAPNGFSFLPEGKLVMKITRDGIWVDPTIEPTITASQVLNVMDGYIKTLCKSVWNDAIDAAAKLVADNYDPCEPWLEVNEVLDLKK